MIKETFEEACSELAKFLQREGQPSNLLWVCREDVTGRRRELFVHPSPPVTNGELYRNHFDFGVQKGLGVRLDVLCFASGRACCHVWVPDDDIAADQAMLADHLRFGYAVEDVGKQRGFQAKQAANAISFLFRRMWCRFRGESPPIRELPSRKELQSCAKANNIRPC